MSDPSILETTMKGFQIGFTTNNHKANQKLRALSSFGESLILISNSTMKLVSQIANKENDKISMTKRQLPIYHF